MQRSPPDRAGSRRSPGKCGSVAKSARPAFREAEPVVEQPGAETEGDGQPRRRQPDRLAGVVGRQVRRALGRADRTGRLALGHPIRGRGPGLEQGDQLARESVVTSNAAKCSRSWAGVTMPAWCAPRNGVRRRGAGRCGAAAALRRAADARTRRPRRRRAATPAAGAGRRRRETSSADLRRVPRSAPSDRRGQLGQRLRQRVDRVGELLDLVGREVVVEREAVADALGVEQRLQVGERGRRASVASSGSLLSRIGGPPRSRPGRRRRWPGSPTGRCATSTPPRR